MSSNYVGNSNYIGNCSRCGKPLHWEPHWTNLLLHKRCFELNKRDVKCQRELDAFDREDVRERKTV